jgi:hypothetical protein
VGKTPAAGRRARRIAAEFSVWGYDVHVERDVREFLEFALMGRTL